MKFGKFKWADDPKLVKALAKFQDKTAPFKLVEVFVPSGPAKRRETIK